MKWLRRSLIALAAVLIGPGLVVASGDVKFGRDWRTADRAPVGIAGDPRTTPEALVQVYAARAFNWRGVFAVHTWIATKEARAPHYRVHQVVGWRRWNNLPVVVSGTDWPDRSWFGHRPQVVAELRGPAAARAIPKVLAAVADYPYENRYAVWPGPNSNTFVAHVARRVPELRIDLPATAIGKDYLLNGALADRAPSGTGFQISLFGLAGIMAALEEGLEINVLGLVFGIDPAGPAVKLPGIGRLGFELFERRGGDGVNPGPA